MKKHLILFFLPFLIAAAPTRVNNFSSGTTIRSAEVNEDFNNLYGYTQTGVDTLRTGAVDAITEISTDIKTSSSTSADVVVGTAGSNGEIANWNTDGTLTDNNVIFGTMTDGKSCSYTSTGTLLSCTQDATGDITRVGDALSGAALVTGGNITVDTISATTITEGGNAVFNSGETPGGELGGTWASPTVDDSITVTGWALGASTATTPAADDDDTSIATTEFVQDEISGFGAGTGDITRIGDCLSGDCFLTTGTATLDTIRPTHVTADTIDANTVTIDTLQSNNPYFGKNDAVSVQMNFDVTGADGIFQYDSGVFKFDNILKFYSDSSPVTDSAAKCAFDDNAWGTGLGTLQCSDGTRTIYMLGVDASDAFSDNQVPKIAAGVISWENDNNTASFTIADTQVTFSDGTDNPTGDSGLVYNKTTDILTSTGGFQSGSSTAPNITMVDSNVTDGGIQGKIAVDCFDPRSGTENCQMTFSRQVDGATVDSIVVSNAGGVTVDTIDVRNGSTSSGILAIYEDSDAGTNKATFQVPSLSTNTVYTLPSDDGSVDEVLSTDGSGGLDWVTASAGSGDITRVGDTLSGDALLTGGNVTVDTIKVGSAGVQLSNDGDGSLTLTGLGDGFDENILFDLDNTSNTLRITSTTGIDNIDADGGGMDFTTDVLYMGRTYVTERAAAGGVSSGQGQVWVKNNNPQDPFFTDDDGTDIQFGDILTTGDCLRGTCFTTGGNATLDTVTIDTISSQILKEGSGNVINSTEPLSGVLYGTLANPGLASSIGGRSITVIPASIDADAELFTDFKGMTIETPTDADNFFAFEAPIALTVTRVTGIVEAATSAVLTWQECDAAGDNCTTIEAVTADVDGAISSGVAIDNASIDAGDIIRLDVGTVTGTVGQAHSTITYTKND